MDPINYSSDVQTPFQAALGGYQAGAAVRDDQTNQLALQQKQQQAQQQALVMQRLISNPNASAKDYADAVLLVPGMKDQLKQGWDQKSAEQQQAHLSDASQYFAAVKNGQPQLAADMMKKRADAMEASGADPRNVQSLRVYSELITAHPEFARATLGQMLAALPGGDKVLTGLTSLGADQRAEAEAPARLATLKAESKIKEAEADVAREKERTGLLKLGADLGLTTAQTAKTLKETEKLGIDIQKAALELGDGGSIDPEKRFDFESKLRKEISDQTKGYQEVRESYQRMKAAQDNGAGDLSLIYSFMKMLDPGSVVREGEFASAENAGGAWSKVGNLYNKVMNGERLSPGQRKTFLGQAESLMGAAAVREKTVRGGIDQVVKSYRLNPDNVFYDPTAAPATGAAAGPQGGTPSGSATTAPSKYQGRKWTQY